MISGAWKPQSHDGVNSITKVMLINSYYITSNERSAAATSIAGNILKLWLDD